MKSVEWWFVTFNRRGFRGSVHMQICANSCFNYALPCRNETAAAMATHLIDLIIFEKIWQESIYTASKQDAVDLIIYPAPVNNLYTGRLTLASDLTDDLCTESEQLASCIDIAAMRSRSSLSWDINEFISSNPAPYRAHSMYGIGVRCDQTHDACVRSLRALMMKSLN